MWVQRQLPSGPHGKAYNWFLSIPCLTFSGSTQKSRIEREIWTDEINVEKFKPTSPSTKCRATQLKNKTSQAAQHQETSSTTTTNSFLRSCFCFIEASRWWFFPHLLSFFPSHSVKIDTRPPAGLQIRRFSLKLLQFVDGPFSSLVLTQTSSIFVCVDDEPSRVKLNSFPLKRNGQMLYFASLQSIEIRKRLKKNVSSKRLAWYL